MGGVEARLIIECSKSKGGNTNLQPGQQVNKVGQFLYRHLDGAFKIEKSGNMCDVWFMILYQIPTDSRRFGHPEDKDMHEMHINLNITTYANKIRVNVIETSPEERTLGCYTFTPEQMSNLNNALELIYNKVINRVAKVYEDYDFIF